MTTRFSSQTLLARRRLSRNVDELPCTNEKPPMTIRVRKSASSLFALSRSFASNTLRTRPRSISLSSSSSGGSGSVLVRGHSRPPSILSISPYQLGDNIDEAGVAEIHNDGQTFLRPDPPFELSINPPPRSTSLPCPHCSHYIHKPTPPTPMTAGYLSPPAPPSPTTKEYLCPPVPPSPTTKPIRICGRGGAASRPRVMSPTSSFPERPVVSIRRSVSMTSAKTSRTLNHDSDSGSLSFSCSPVRITLEDQNPSPPVSPLSPTFSQYERCGSELQTPPATQAPIPPYFDFSMTLLGANEKEKTPINSKSTWRATKKDKLPAIVSSFWSKSSNSFSRLTDTNKSSLDEDSSFASSPLFYETTPVPGSTIEPPDTTTLETLMEEDGSNSLSSILMMAPFCGSDFGAETETLLPDSSDLSREERHRKVSLSLSFTMDETPPSDGRDTPFIDSVAVDAQLGDWEDATRYDHDTWKGEWSENDIEEVRRRLRML
ncbi:hypothetical protein VKT23_000514 [Stygiomarasmius scandens]|uniref:Uncharacterized protein n=1 Tax=Marasmiellus scandens TaxID=2682957 RepID=A0ABR1K6Z4_9AGAR